MAYFAEAGSLRRLVARLVRVPHTARSEERVFRIFHQPVAVQVSRLVNVANKSPLFIKIKIRFDLRCEARRS